jgi:small-conductance mechanosensitive channel
VLTDAALVLDFVSNPLTSRDPVVKFIANLVLTVGLVVLVLVITFAVAHYASGRLRAALERGGFQLNTAILLARSVWFAIWAIGVLYLLYRLGVEPSALTAVIGVVGIALGLSLQAVLQNLVAGVYLLAERPFKIGDVIAVIGPAGANHEGKVEDIQMRTTQLRNRDDELIMIPNSSVFGGVVTNRTAVGGYVGHVSVTFPRQTDPEAIRERIVPLLQRLPSILPHPGPQLRLDKMGKDDWTASILFWVHEVGATSDAIWTIGRAFPEACVDTDGELATP